MLYTHIPKP